MAGLLVLAVSAGACGDAAPRPVPGAARDLVLLLAGNTLGGGARAAALLQDMAAATDVLGPVEVRCEGTPGEDPAALLGRLQARGLADLRAVVLVVGDLTLLPGIRPDEPLPPQHELTRRTIDLAALDAVLARFEELTRRHGVTLVIASAPLGQQGRVEVPELLVVGEHLRRRGPLLDLQQAFEPLARAALFSDGLDALDDWGHEVLARELYDQLLADSWVAPRDEREGRARAQMTALRSWATGDGASQDETRRVLEQGDQALAAEADGPSDAPRLREAARLAALALLLDGPRPEVVARWPEADAGEGAAGEVPGLALGRLLCSLPPTADRTEDPLEREGCAVLLSLGQASAPADPWQAAQALVAAHPERLEAWLVLETVMVAHALPVDVRSAALACSTRLRRPPVHPRRWRLLLDDQPRSLEALPALVVASRPEMRLRPLGPELEAARRATLRGLPELAGRLLQQACRQQPVPPSWLAEQVRLAAGPR